VAIVVSVVMKTGKKIANTLCAAAFLAAAAPVLSFSGPALAASDCAKFPKVAIWGDISHRSVTRYVDRKLEGDWVAYTERLDKIATRLEDLHRQGKAAIVKMKGQRARFKGESLAQYIRDSEIRIGIVRCLGEEAAAAGFDNFSTAAGGDLAPPEPAAAAPEATGKKVYRMYLSLPLDVVGKLRKRAVRQGLDEGRLVSVNDVVLEILRGGLE